MTRHQDVSRFALYGEGEGIDIAPEFIHMEPISARSSLFEWQIAPHSHPGIFQLLFLEKGMGELTTDGQSIQLRPAALVALPSGCIHAFRFEPGAEGWVLSLASQLMQDPRLAGLAPAQLEENAVPRWVHVEPEDATARNFARAMQDVRLGLGEQIAGSLPDLLVARLAVALLLAHALLAGKGSNAQRPGRREELVRRFRAEVELRFRDGAGVDIYASRLGTTAATLTRACREVLGKPPGELVLDRVLLEAMRNLTFTGSTIGQVAEGLGFSDMAYFSRFFRKRTGLSPSEFRRRRAWIRRD
ncbi:MAG: helix-turn-helix domain-containing protein [Sphingomonadaceae bacterium]|nr:helix-turn-helix domain-containing protein [Sphingomonadaceae bacterium]